MCTKLFLQFVCVMTKQQGNQIHWKLIIKYRYISSEFGYLCYARAIFFNNHLHLDMFVTCHLTMSIVVAFYDITKKLCNNLMKLTKSIGVTNIATLLWYHCSKCVHKNDDAPEDV